MSEVVCCAGFAQAMEIGTDNEEYGQLISWADFKTPPGWHIGAGHLARIDFCPWCGKNLEEDYEEVNHGQG